MYPAWSCFAHRPFIYPVVVAKDPIVGKLWGFAKKNQRYLFQREGWGAVNPLALVRISETRKLTYKTKFFLG